ncbi:MAG: 5'/3'-nucleotidase SurE [Ignavibacteriae bacterium]|nr:5'/3'-nucleotidase SurE [Ignavibacteriota bacterium]
MKRKPTILISNDDGIGADGIKALAKEIRKFANVIVAAPHTQQSAVGHSITMSSPIRVKEELIFKDFYGYAIEGTPADSVKLAVHTLLKDKKIDLLISGINQGANTAINTIYSGTVSAATEGTILGIPSIAISLTSYTYNDFSFAAKFASKIAKVIIKKGLPKGTLLNINVPAIKKIKGVKITKQGKSSWDDTYEIRIDPGNRKYYWLTGSMLKIDKTTEYDVKAVDEGYISVTPIHYDLTDYKMYEEMKSWKI